AEETQDGVEQAVARNITRDDRLEDVRVADLACPAHRAFCLESIHRGLHGRVRGARLGKTLLDLANRRVAPGPQDFENLQFKPGKLGGRLGHLLSNGYNYYTIVDDVKRRSHEGERQSEELGRVSPERRHELREEALRHRASDQTVAFRPRIFRQIVRA